MFTLPVMARILIIKLGALGDTILATPIIEQIRCHHAGEAVTVLTAPPFENIFCDWPGLDAVTFARKGVRAALATVAWIRRQRFDRVYDLQSSDRTRAYCALSGIPERVGNHPRWPYTLHPADRYSGGYHIFERLNQVLHSAGIAPAKPVVYLPLAEAKRQEVGDWLRQQNLADDQFAIMHAGASEKHAHKCWPYYRQLAEVLQEQGVNTVWIGGREDSEKNRMLAKTCGVDASQCFSINQLAELARHARFALTNDSGPMHALSGSGIPVYAFFGLTNHVRNHALGQEGHVITRQPPGIKGKRLANPDYRLANIDCEEVLSRLRRDNVIN